MIALALFRSVWLCILMMAAIAGIQYVASGSTPSVESALHFLPGAAPASVIFGFVWAFRDY